MFSSYVKKEVRETDENILMIYLHNNIYIQDFIKNINIKYMNEIYFVSY